MWAILYNLAFYHYREKNPESKTATQRKMNPTEKDYYEMWQNLNEWDGGRGAARGGSRGGSLFVSGGVVKHICFNYLFCLKQHNAEAFVWILNFVKGTNNCVDEDMESGGGGEDMESALWMLYGLLNFFGEWVI